MGLLFFACNAFPRTIAGTQTATGADFGIDAVRDEVFADTGYWMAVVSPSDDLHEEARKAKERLGAVKLVTTDEVLVEFLNYFGGKGPKLRELAARMTKRILDDPNVRVLQQTRESFLSGLELYRQRVDKEYSLVDCVSMVVMRKQGLQEILTGDHHFSQEGLTVLMGGEA